jgi:hypothetical protein
MTPCEKLSFDFSPAGFLSFSIHPIGFLLSISPLTLQFGG